MHFSASPVSGITHAQKASVQEGTCTELRATYWTLQDLGDPLLLLHHVEILPQVWRHVPATKVLWVTLVHAVKVALLGVVAGQGQGQRPRSMSHIHQTHVLTVRPPTLSLEERRKQHSSPQTQTVKAEDVVSAENTVWVQLCGDSCNYTDKDKRERTLLRD